MTTVVKLILVIKVDKGGWLSLTRNDSVRTSETHKCLLTVFSVTLVSDHLFSLLTFLCGETEPS